MKNRFATGRTANYAVVAVGILASLSTASAEDCVPTWDGALGTPGMGSGYAADFVTHDDGSGGGDQLYAVGNFSSAGGVAGTANIAKWTGSTWASVGGGLGGGQFTNVMEVFDGNLYAGGYFNDAGGVPETAKIARWDGTNWHSIGADLAFFTNSIWDLRTWDDGSGEALYIAGNYTDIGGTGGPDFIARYDGTGFSELNGTIGGGGIALIVLTLELFDDGDGEALYIGGRFSEVGGVQASRIAKWDGRNWSPLGTGLGTSPTGTQVLAMTTFDEGDGEALYVGGTFSTAGNQPADRVAKWDGESWSPMGDGLDAAVQALTVYDNGDGPALYAAGNFTMSGSTPVDRIARWNGTSWEPVPGGAAANIFGLHVWDNGEQDVLVVGGSFTEIGGVAANRVATYVGCTEEPGIPGDLNGDGAVDTEDLFILLAAWGACDDPNDCPADLDDNGEVDTEDLFILLANWG